VIPHDAGVALPRGKCRRTKQCKIRSTCSFEVHTFDTEERRIATARFRQCRNNSETLVLQCLTECARIDFPWSANIAAFGLSLRWRKKNENG